MSKLCRTCAQEKAAIDFHSNVTYSSGRDNTCITCRNKQGRDRRNANIVEAREKEATYRSSLKGTLARKAYRRRLSAIEANRLRASINRTNPDIKLKARVLVRKAVKDRSLIRPSVCSRCNHTSDRPIEAHHSDYSKPLDVEWLCILCHRTEL